MKASSLCSIPDLDSAAALEQDIRDRAAPVGGVLTLSVQSTDDLGIRYGMPRRQVEERVLELGMTPLRYVRNLGTIGIEGQLRLLRSTVAVVGLGGLGGFVVEGLARMGVGRLLLIDGDIFCDHNLNRQLLSTESNLGMPKAQAAADRVRQINGAVETIVYVEHATRESLSRLLRGADVLVDAVDRLSTRLMLQKVAASLDIPMVHGAIAGWMGQVMTIFPGDPGLRALYGDGEVPEHGAEVELGTPPASPMLVAAWEVHETVKLLVGAGDLLRGRMLFIDAASGDARFLSTG